MSENLKQQHLKVDKFYSDGYLKTWCGAVREEWTEFLDRVFTILGKAYWHLAGFHYKDYHTVEIILFKHAY